ncbi:unnamed protein product [Cunninghamella blakesleeana]
MSATCLVVSFIMDPLNDYTYVVNSKSIPFICEFSSVVREDDCYCTDCKPFLPLIMKLKAIPICIYLLLVLYIQKGFSLTATPVELVENYRTSKNVLFIASVGGSTHVNWVLYILKELEQRGHNVTFVTKDDHARFGKQLDVNTISIGPSTVPKDDTIKKDNSHLNPRIVMSTLIGHITKAYPSEYLAFKDIMGSLQTDLAICDHFVDSCIEAARFHKIPFVITATLAITPDAQASFVSNSISLYGVHNNQISLFERIYHNYFFTISLLWNHFDTVMSVGKTKTDLGIKSSIDTMATWKDSLKLINTAFGLENARSLGPLVEFIGPILPRTYTPLITDDDASNSYHSFLEHHKKVVYIAFGQNAITSLVDRYLLWTSILTLLESGDIDGVIWVDKLFTNYKDNHDEEVLFTIPKSENKKTYTISDIANHPHILITSWAPQFAILQHPSTILFITHGGVGSLMESLYCAKPMAVFPFVGDQLGLARNIEYQQLGVFLNRDESPKTMTKSIQQLLNDEIIQKNIKRYSALVQIHSKHGAIRGANLIEEVLFTYNPHRGLHHRYEASRDMNILVKYNLDVYLIFVFLLIISFFTAKWIGYKLIQIVKLYLLVKPKQQ